MHPNGKIYVGKDDLTDSINYFGSAISNLIRSRLHRRIATRFHDPTDILWESQTASDSEMSLKEAEFIRAMNSNDPASGYNRWPKLSE